MRSFFSAAFFLILLSFAFSACGGDSGTSPNKDSNASEETGSDKGDSSSRGKSSSSNKKESSDTSSNVNKKSSSSKKGKNISSSSSSKSFKKCTSDKEGVRAFVTQENSWCICINGLWIPESSSSSVEPSSSSKYYDMSKQFVSKNNYSYGEFTDPRDGQVYKTIRYPFGFGVDSVTFFAENINFGKMIPAGTQQIDSTKYCYDDDPWYCENGFGGLYTWATAMNFPAVCDSFPTGSVECPDTVDLTGNNLERFYNSFDYAFHKGLCPDGWHLMNLGEWAAVLKGSVTLDGGSYLGTSLWGLDNQRGFSLLPAGILKTQIPYNSENISLYTDLGKDAYHWVHGEYKNDEDSLTSYGKSVLIQQQYTNRSARAPKVYGLSVRCVMDY